MNGVPFYGDLAPLFDQNKSRGQLTAKEVVLKINAFSFGDTLCATPILRKLALAYAKKIVVCSAKPPLFKNNPYVKFHINHDEFRDEYDKQYEVFNTFNSIGKADKTGIERRYSEFDMRRCHAADCGLDLMPQEMSCDYFPDPVEFEEADQKFINDNKYIVIHIAKNWPSRTWDKKNYEELIKNLNGAGHRVALIGFDQPKEPGRYQHDKSCYNFSDLEFEGVSFLNRTSLDQDFYIIKNAEACITMNTGIVHLAGCTDTHITCIGSSINPYWYAPYRNGTQSYKFLHVNGECLAFCASNAKWSVVEHGSSNSIPPLPECLEGRPSFECHPSPDKVFASVLSILK
tara:strand:+ start:1608 stop:2642 length:1035 start_codon:yes stop_codon:yes gene_type:complete